MFGMQLNEITIGKISISIWRDIQLPSDDPTRDHHDFSIEVGDDWVCIGGGARAATHSAGIRGSRNFLTASFPMSDWRTWKVMSRDHIIHFPVTLFGFAIGMKVDGLARDELIANLRHTSSISPTANFHTDHSCLVEPGFLLLGGGFEVLDQMESGGNMATSSFPDSSISWRARSKDEIYPTESRIRVFTIGISPCIKNAAGEVVGNVATSFSSFEDPSSLPYYPTSEAHPLPGYALCGGGGDAHYDVNQLLWLLEPTSVAKPFNPADPFPGPEKITDPSLQKFTAGSSTQFGSSWVLNANKITAYAMGIKFEPVTPAPKPIPAPPPITECDRFIPLTEPMSSGYTSGSDHSKVVDGNFNTKWVSTNILSPWLSIGLREQKPVCKVDIAWADGNARKYNFYIESSMDGQNWNTILTTANSSGNSNGFESYIVSKTMAKRIKITVTGTVPGPPSGTPIGTTAQITEVQVLSNQ